MSEIMAIEALAKSQGHIASVLDRSSVIGGAIDATSKVAA
jgi:hypothetical protein